MKPPAPDLSRRGLLAGAASAVAAVGFSRAAQAQAAAAPARPALPAYVAWKNPDHMIVHTGTTIETRRSAFGTSVITPAERLYIRNNLPAPDVSIVADRDAWAVAVEGVRQPRVLTVAQLKTLGLETVAAVLQCSGNGRGYFADKPSGTKWQVGAAGCVIWSGVPVRNVIAALGGVADGARFMTGTGGEALPAGLDPKSVVVERSVPLRAFEDALLAWEMNGEPLPHAHGGPLRLIVPGYSGINNIKYVKRLAFTAAETDAAIQKTGYRLTPSGVKGDPSFPAVWEMGVKSWINGPAPEAGPVKAGMVQVHGVAMGGTRDLRRIDVSIDGGQTWQEARFVGPDLGRFAWRQFVLPVRLPPGQHLLASRAQDSRFEWQVEESPANGGGFLNSGWRSHAIPLTVT
ncbi:MAG: sulfite oxidase-like protein [Ramlibacter sp.]|jgi:DMSO/TMAO reductase YedYZ molybdopterin-dependent catalytic subunit|uniref:SorT family sulfite dehydrogenase catalytic subunit n=1 Tax=Ramlibacter sp. TaxID=1917967 RepID=UPI0026092AF3|nr:sulfite oxidase [Ramlibacter sp.]MDB5751675.1 sulfite oxidase-like protein [Ramlibacter sp.]